MVRLLTPLHDGKAMCTHFKRTPDLAHPVGPHRQVETTLCCLVEVTAGFCLREHVLDELHSSTEILPAQGGEVAGDHATCTHFQVRVSEFVRYGQRLLCIGDPFCLLSQVDRQQHRESSQDLHRLRAAPFAQDH